MLSSNNKAMIRIAVPKTKYYEPSEMTKELGKYTICAWDLEYRGAWNMESVFDEIMGGIEETAETVKETIEEKIDAIVRKVYGGAVVNLSLNIIIGFQFWVGVMEMFEISKNTFCERELK